jgi:hypothetical protein
MFADRLPSWLAVPVGALGIVAAITGSGLVFWATIFGSYVAAAVGAVAFFVAALFWYVADFAASGHPFRGD